MRVESAFKGWLNSTEVVREILARDFSSWRKKIHYKEKNLDKVKDSSLMIVSHKLGIINRFFSKLGSLNQQEHIKYLLNVFSVHVKITSIKMKFER